MNAARTASSKIGRTRSVTRFTKFPKPPKYLRNNPDTGLPQPHVKVLVRDYAPSRLQDHYHNTLADNLMYMTYNHVSSLHPPRPPRVIRPKYDPNDPYTKHRDNPPVGGSQIGKKPAPPTTAENVVKLKKIQIHTMVKEAVASRSHLLGAIAALRALSGETLNGGGRHTSQGVQIVRAKKAVGGWIRPNVPVAAKVDITGPAMYDFIATLVEFVLPRVRDFPGLIMPPASTSMQTPAGVSGVVSFGLPEGAMSFFPQIEVNQDAYPKMYGMHIHFITDAEGQGAQNRARALMSGFQLPFARK